ncbi:glycosyltransferase family 2 protein [Cnuibacter sp. UC19_7]|uniref:glycosyltransferase family 2 protein n=1 Tax=Cnuibacter sp. UC19_7 TaxID=3350166 RepID=UPI003670B9B7
MSGPRVAVVTVSYGSESVLGPFLDSVRTASADPSGVVVVVADNKPVSPSPVEEIAAGHSATYLPLPSNRGYGGGMNAAVAALPPGVEWVLVSNPDIVLEPGSLDQLVAAGEASHDIGAVGPRVMTDGAVYPSARAIPSVVTGAGHALLSRVWPGNPWTRAYRRDTSTEPVARDAGWLSGSCQLVRRTAFDAIGGFDESYFMYFEDVDLGHRLGRAGWRNRYEPSAIVAHSGAHSTEGESVAMLRAHHESAYRFMAARYPSWWQWPLRAALKAGLSLRLAVESRRATR